jgi:hypothetical protein
MEDPSDDEFVESPEGNDTRNKRFVGHLPGVGRDFDDRLTAQQKEIKGLQRTMDTKFDELKEIKDILRELVSEEPDEHS